MGPMLTSNLAGRPGGISHLPDHFGPALLAVDSAGPGTDPAKSRRGRGRGGAGGRNPDRTPARGPARCLPCRPAAVAVTPQTRRPRRRLTLCRRRFGDIGPRSARSGRLQRPSVRRLLRSGVQCGQRVAARAQRGQGDEIDCTAKVSGGFDRQTVISAGKFSDNAGAARWVFRRRGWAKPRAVQAGRGSRSATTHRG